MKKNYKYILALSLFMTSCLGSKFLQESESLLVKVNIENVPRKEKYKYEDLLAQRPNSTFLGGIRGSILKYIIPPFSLSAHIYQLGKKHYNQEKIAKKIDQIAKEYNRRVKKEPIHKEAKIERIKKRREKKIEAKKKVLNQGNFLMRIGEPLEVYEKNKSIEGKNNIEKYLFSGGYFNNNVEYDTSIIDKKRKHLLLTYTPHFGKRYTIDSIRYIINDTLIKELILKNRKKSPLQKGFYDQKNITSEREFLFQLVIENGHYLFSKKYISFEIDSIATNKKHSLHITEKIIIPEGIKNPRFYFDSVHFVARASLTGKTQRKIEQYKGVRFNFENAKYSKQILRSRILIHKEDVYKKSTIIETQRQLSLLQNFKFLNIHFDTTQQKITTYIYTSPIDKYQVSVDGGISISQGLPGPFGSFDISSRNLLRSLDIMNLNVNIKTEGINNVSEKVNTYSSLQYGGSISLTFPNFLFPVINVINPDIKRQNPKTTFSFSAEFRNRRNEYERLTFQTSIDYSWQKDQKRYRFTPLQVSFINSKNTEGFQKFLEILELLRSSYANAFRSAFVSLSKFEAQLLKGDYKNHQIGSYWEFKSEIGGNLNDLFNSGILKKNIETYQFIRLNVDHRKILKIRRNLNIAYHINVALAYPLGKNNALPYGKYYYGGGSNGMRAWFPRRLGPGTYGKKDTKSNDPTIIDDSREQPGEFFFISSLELRQKLSKISEVAFFLDLGNIWLLPNSRLVNPLDDYEKDDGIFRVDHFLKEMALGSGIGLRWNFGFLLLRLDLGIKLIDPAQPSGRRFVGNQFFSNFRKVSAINIAIGYPF